MWQDIIVALIGLAVLFYLIRKIYKMCTSKKSDDPCCGCSGCALKKKGKRPAA